MATSGFSYGKSAAQWNVFVIFVMAWCWLNATESKPHNVSGHFMSKTFAQRKSIKNGKK